VNNHDQVLATLWATSHPGRKLLVEFKFRETGERQREAGALNGLGEAARALMYGILAYTAAKLLGGDTTPKDDEQQTLTARLLAKPGGRWLVGVADATILAFGLGYAGYGLARRFETHLTGGGSAVRWLGMVGYAAKGIAYAVAGGLVVASAVTYDPSRSRGLDAALRTMAAQPHGRLLLYAVAAGIAAYGLFAIAEARYRRV